MHTSTIRTLLLTAAVSLAVASQGTAQSVVINEINYSSPDGFNPGDWVELYNPEETVVDLAGWRFEGDGEGETYLVPTGVLLDPQGYVVLAEDPGAFAELFPEVTAVGPLNYAFSGAGELLVLYNAEGGVVDSVRYSDSEPWPEAADGAGFTLTLLDPGQDNNVPESWTASVEIGGTPGAENDVVVLPIEPPRIVINEINYHPASTFNTGDWVELYHADPSFGPADLSRWYFRDDNDENVYLFPENTMLEPGQFLVLVEDTEAFQALFPGVQNVLGDLAFNLSNGGDRARLYSRQNNLVDSLTYDDEAPWPTAPDSTGPTLELIDPASDNTLAESWAASMDVGGTPGAPNSVLQVAAEDPGDLPNALAVTDAYPNPFRAETTLRYTLAHPGRVALRVYDPLGREVAVLVDEQRPAGRHEETWAPRSLAAGLYLAKLTVDGEPAGTKALVLMR